MAEKNNSGILHISSSPHIRHHQSVPSIMLTVVIALVPAFIASVVFFGTQALSITAVCVITAVLTEWIIVRIFLKKENTIHDYSAIVTGILLAFNLPPDIPLWMAATGSVFSIAVVKWTFGGLGNNFINPALAGRAFLMASYPASMTSFSATSFGSMAGISSNIQAITSATPLVALKDGIESGSIHILEIQEAIPNLFLGNTGGCIGETSVLALFTGACLMWYKRVIGLKIPACYILTVFLLFWIFNGTGSPLTSDALIIPLFNILSGGLILGALFMATDMVTSPITPLGKIIFGTGCGILTFVIRKFGGYPEGVSYSILLMNLTVPLIDRYTRPAIYGKVCKK